MRALLRSLAVTCVVVCLALTATAASAQPYPSKPITIVVPFAPGSGTDSITRIIAQYLQTALNQSIVVENKVGASGVIAATYVARAAPDGYTLLMATNSTHSANPYLFKKLDYDPVKDFAPVARLGCYVFMLVVNKDVPAQDASRTRRPTQSQSRQAFLRERQHHRASSRARRSRRRPASTSCTCPTSRPRRRSTTCWAGASR